MFGPHTNPYQKKASNEIGFSPPPWATVSGVWNGGSGTVNVPGLRGVIFNRWLHTHSVTWQRPSLSPSSRVCMYLYVWHADGSGSARTQKPLGMRSSSLCFSVFSHSLLFPYLSSYPTYTLAVFSNLCFLFSPHHTSNHGTITRSHAVRPAIESGHSYANLSFEIK